MEDQRWALLASTCVLTFESDKDGSLQVSGIEDVMGNSMDREALLAIERYCKKRLALSDEVLKNQNIVKVQKRQDFYSRIKIREIEKIGAPGIERDFKYIYLAKDGLNGAIKIGITKNVDSRMLQLKTANASISILHIFEGMRSDEKALHEKFTKMGKRIGGEWFSLDDNDISFIQTYFDSKTPA